MGAIIYLPAPDDELVESWAQSFTCLRPMMSLSNHGRNHFKNKRP
jgi:hypothetical protein